MFLERTTTFLGEVSCMLIRLTFSNGLQEKAIKLGVSLSGKPDQRNSSTLETKSLALTDIRRVKLARQPVGRYTMMETGQHTLSQHGREDEVDHEM